jgi:O-antigen/teichoic acid export membrane protein
MKQWLITISRSETTRNFLVYSFGALFVKGVSFFLLPLYTRLLSPEEYGLIDLLTTFSNLVDITLSLGLFQYLFMEYFHIGAEQRNKLIRSTLTVFIKVSTWLYAALLLTMLVGSSWLFGEIPFWWVALVMVTNYLTFFQGLVILLLRMDRKAVPVTVYQVAYGVISILLNLYFVYVLSTGVQGILTSAFISVALAFLVALIYLGKRCGFYEPTGAQELKSIMKLSLPFVPNALAIWGMISLNRWILLHETDMAQVGLFSVASKFSSLFDPLVIQPFLSAYTPKTLERFSKGDRRQHLAVYGIGSLILFTLAGLLLMWVASFMVDQQYKDSLWLIVPLSSAGAFALMTQMSNIILVHRKKVKLILISVLTGTFLNVIITWLLVDSWQAGGAAWAALAGNFAWMATTMWFALREKRELAA